MSLWNLIYANIQHVRRFGHTPDWQSFNGWLVCERCLKPPSRPLRMRPVVVARGTMGL